MKHKRRKSPNPKICKNQKQKSQNKNLRFADVVKLICQLLINNSFLTTSSYSSKGEKILFNLKGVCSCPLQHAIGGTQRPGGVSRPSRVVDTKAVVMGRGSRPASSQKESEIRVNPQEAESCFLVFLEKWLILFCVQSGNVKSKKSFSPLTPLLGGRLIPLAGRSMKEETFSAFNQS